MGNIPISVCHRFQEICSFLILHYPSVMFVICGAFLIKDVSITPTTLVSCATGPSYTDKTKETTIHILPQQPYNSLYIL